MQVAISILLGLVVAGQVVFGLAKLFTHNNINNALRKQNEDYIRRILELDKEYIKYKRNIHKNLNKITYWLRTGHEEVVDKDDFEDVEIPADHPMRDTIVYNREIQKKQRKAKIKLANETIDTEAKSKRVPELYLDNLNAAPIGTTEATFYYSSEYNEHIFFCAIPEHLEKKRFKYVIYFTTAKPDRIPLIYPHKYEGATMLSMYDYPSIALWFLHNWKNIRTNLEQEAEVNPEIENALEGFDV